MCSTYALDLAYHILGTKSLLDPFLRAGFGLWAYDYMNKEELEELGWYMSDDPLMGSTYFDLGGGLGVNFGDLGIFF
ncbi:MAG TPA: hypothetical protein VJ967_05215 [Clostridia bacterium]|nr:hypothetical protein [Clostridia bacterium]